MGERLGLPVGERKELKAIVISPPVSQDRTNVPGLVRFRKGEREGDNFAQGQFRCQQYTNSSFGYISAMSVEELMLLLAQQVYDDREFAAVARVASPLVYLPAFNSRIARTSSICGSWNSSRSAGVSESIQRISVRSIPSSL